MLYDRGRREKGERGGRGSCGVSPLARAGQGNDKAMTQYRPLSAATGLSMALAWPGLAAIS